MRRRSPLVVVLAVLALLAALAISAGFATAGFVAAIPLASSLGFAQGFEHYDEPERRVLGFDVPRARHAGALGLDA